MLLLDAEERSLPVVSAVAVGAAEALGLPLEPAVRLRTIAVEAAGNVVAHAYPDGSAGPLEVEICPEGERLRVQVRDRGVGLRVPPAAKEPPGLGLSMISSLADDFTVASGSARGTSLEATIVADAEPAGVRRLRATAPTTSELQFGDDAFVRPILGRALAATVSTGRIDLDRLEETLQVGDAIADCLPDAAERSTLPILRFSRSLPSPQLRISVGPLVAAATERLAATLRTALNPRIPSVRISSEPRRGGGALMLLTLPV